MNRDGAEEIVRMLMRAANEMVATLDVCRAHASEEELKRHTKAVGAVMFAIDDVLRPITNEHPDLHP